MQRGYASIVPVSASSNRSSAFNAPRMPITTKLVFPMTEELLLPGIVVVLISPGTFLSVVVHVLSTDVFLNGSASSVCKVPQREDESLLPYIAVTQ